MSLKLTLGVKFASVTKWQTVKKKKYQSNLVAFSILIARLSLSVKVYPNTKHKEKLAKAWHNGRWKCA